MGKSDKEVLLESLIKAGFTCTLKTDKKTGLHFIIAADPVADAELGIDVGTSFTFDREGVLLTVESYVPLSDSYQEPKAVTEALKAASGNRVVLPLTRARPKSAQ